MPRNLPNILTLTRIAAIPIVVAFLYFPESYGGWMALGVYVYACITDFFDGYLARSMNVQSALGRMLDPIADKLLIAAILLALVDISRLTNWDILAAGIILFREILVSGLREFLAEVRVSLPVSRLAKWKTGIQMFCLGFLLVGPAGPMFGPFTTTELGLALLWLAASLTAVTGYDYLRAGLKHIKHVDAGVGQVQETPPSQSMNAKQGETKDVA